jgi:hypothetical protein
VLPAGCVAVRLGYGSIVVSLSDSSLRCFCFAGRCTAALPPVLLGRRPYHWFLLGSLGLVCLYLFIAVVLIADVAVWFFGALFR